MLLRVWESFGENDDRIKNIAIDLVENYVFISDKKRKTGTKNKTNG